MARPSNWPTYNCQRCPEVGHYVPLDEQLYAAQIMNKLTYEIYLPAFFSVIIFDQGQHTIAVVFAIYLAGLSG